MVRVPREQVLMRMAKAVALRGTCDRLQVGAVIAVESRVISTGYNGAPAGMDHCHHSPADERCERSVHAEANAIAFAAKLGGVGTDGGTLIVTHAPCVDCAKLIINAGIREVFFETAYRLTAGREMLEHAGVVVTQLHP